MEPLQGVSDPFSSPALSLVTAHLGALLILAFVLAFLVWAMFAAVASYHWLRYARGSRIAIPVVGGYLIGSFLLLCALALTLI